MSFTAAIATCFGKYWTFKGRASRAEFWWFMLFGILAGFTADKFDRLVFGTDAAKHPLVGFGTVVSFVVGLPALTVGCRRLHDIGKSGWWQTLLLLAPLAIELGKLFKRNGAGELSNATFVVVLVMMALPFYWWSKPTNAVGDKYQ
jgi:uncharacterized membrane protein YhaH (DUF805 family)